MIRKLMMTLSAFIIVSSASLTYAASSNEGITCINRGSTVQAVYDKANGRTIRRNIRVGQSYKGGQCMGRCGAACGNFLPDAWTKDCLDHDICVADQNGQNQLGSDPNCGNEFNHAASDYIWGVWRGCSG